MSTAPADHAQPPNGPAGRGPSGCPRPGTRHTVAGVAVNSAREGAMTRVFLVDDHEIVRRGIRELFADHPDLDIVGEAGSVADALATIQIGRASCRERG